MMVARANFNESELLGVMRDNRKIWYVKLKSQKLVINVGEFSIGDFSALL